MGCGNSKAAEELREKEARRKLEDSVINQFDTLDLAKKVGKLTPDQFTGEVGKILKADAQNQEILTAYFPIKEQMSKIGMGPSTKVWTTLDKINDWLDDIGCKDEKMNFSRDAYDLSGVRNLRGETDFQALGIEDYYVIRLLRREIDKIEEGDELAQWNKEVGEMGGQTMG